MIENGTFIYHVRPRRTHETMEEKSKKMTLPT